MSAITAPLVSSRPESVRQPTRYVVLAGAILIQLILGTVYGYSIFWAPLQAQIFPPVLTAAQAEARVASGQSVEGYEVVADARAARVVTDQRQGLLKYAFSICILSFALVMVVAGRIQDVLGPRIPALIGGALMALGFLLAGAMNQPVVWMVCHAGACGLAAIVGARLVTTLYALVEPERGATQQILALGVGVTVAVAGVLIGTQYVGRLGEYDRVALLWGTIGFLSGAGVGFAYVCPIAALVKWFPHAKGLVSGLAVAGFGLGAYVFKDPRFGAPAYFSAHGITGFFLVHGLVCLAAVSLGAMMLRNPPSAAAPPRAADESSWQQTLRQPAFYALWLMFFSGALSGLMVIGIVAEFVKEQLAGGAVPAGDELARLAAKGAAAVGWLAIFNAVGRVFWGLLSDRVGRTPAFVMMFVFQAATLSLLATLTSELGLTIGAAVIGFNFGGNFALFPSATADLFGARNLGANYGWVFTSYGVAGVIGVAAGNAAKVATGSYRAAFLVAAALCVLSACVSVWLAVARRQARGAPAGAAA